MRTSSRSRISVRPLRLAALVAIATALAACSADAPAPATAAPADPPAASAPSALTAHIDRAIADHRLYAPAGDNAIEYYLAQRETATADAAATEAALIELQPYAMIAAEQAIAGADLGEAERLVALMARIDGAAPSLARLRDDIAAARRAEADAEARAKAAAEAAVTAEAAAQAAAQAAAPMQPRTVEAPPARTAATPRTAEPAAPAPSRPAPRPVAARESTPTQAPAAAPVARPTAPTSTDLVPVSTPFPPFPSEAIARGRSMGSVTVRFTVRASGRVTDVRIVEARPAGLFERTVNETLAEWRFEPIAADRVQTRTFNFRN